MKGRYPAIASGSKAFEMAFLCAHASLWSRQGQAIIVVVVP